MFFPVFYRAVPTAWFKHRFVGFESTVITSQCFIGNAYKTNTANTSWCIYEELINKVGVQAQGFEDLCTMIGTNCGDAHFGHNLHNAAYSCFNVVLFCLFRCNITKTFTSL